MVGVGSKAVRACRNVGRSVADHERWIVLGVVLAYVAAYALLSIAKHQSFHSTAFDLAVYDQIFWNTIQGRPFESTLDRGICEPHSFLGGHFSPVLLLLAPLYAAVPRVETLLVLQTAALGAGAWPIYLLARSRFPAGWQRLVWVAAYFLIVPLAHMNLFDFHIVTLAVPLLGLALYFLDRGRTVAFAIALGSTFLVKEELPLVALGFAAYVLVAKRDWLLGGAVAAASVAWFVFAVKVAIPAFNAGAEYHYLDFYARLGDTELDIARTVLTDPVRTGQVLLTDANAKLRYLLVIFGPGLGATLLSGPGVLLVLPQLGYTLLSGYAPQYAFENHYSATLVPLALATSLFGVARLRPRWRTGVLLGVLAASVVLSLRWGALPHSRGFDASRFDRDARYAEFTPHLTAIDPRAAVMAQDFVASHLAQRRLLYYEGYQRTCAVADWIVLDYADPQFVKRDRDKHRREIAKFERSGFETVARGDGLALLRRRPVGGRGRSADTLVVGARESGACAPGALAASASSRDRTARLAARALVDERPIAPVCQRSVAPRRDPAPRGVLERVGAALRGE